MKPTESKFQTPGLLPAVLTRGFPLFLLAAFLFPAVVRSQPVIGLAPEPLSMPAGASGFKSAIPSSTVAGSGSSAAGQAPLQWGPMEIRPHFAYTYSYSDGVQARPGSPANTSIHTIAPGLLFKVGDWAVNYTATQTLYSQGDLVDSLDHAFTILGGKSKTIGNWVVGLTLGYATSFAPQIETARQTKQQSATTGLNAAYAFNSRVNLALGVTQNLRFSKAAGDVFDWMTMNWLNYQASQNFSAGVGLGLGYTDIADAPNTSSRRFLVRAGWKISRKIGVDFDGGVEGRDSTSKAVSNSNNPIYNLTLHYEPFDQTKISIIGGRSKTISLFENRESETQRWGLRLGQRLLGHLMFSAGYSQQKVSYAPSTKAVASNRSDETSNFDASLGVTIRKRGTIGLTFQRNKNDSDLTGFGFSSSQFGVQFGYAY